MRITARLAFLLALAAAGGCGVDFDDRMAAIRALQEAGRFEESIEELREVLAERPEQREASYRLGSALARTGKASRSIWALEQASESSEFVIPASLELAVVQFQLDNFEESIRASDRVLAVDPHHREALRVRAQAHVGARQLEAALADARQLLELEPDDYAMLIVHATVLAELGRTPEAEIAHDRIKIASETSGDRDLAARGCLAPAVFAQVNLEDLEHAEELYEDCASKYPADRVAINYISGFFDSIGKPARASELMERAVEEAPEDLPLRSALAARLERQGRAEDAEALLREAVDRYGAAEAGKWLVDHYRRQQRPGPALALIEQMIEQTGAAGQQLEFIRADLLVDMGELDRAEKLADELAEPSHASMIRGRVLLARGDAKAALAAFDRGIASWPNNAGARYLAGMAALQLGDFERAIVELRESARVDAAATDAARILARLYFDRRDYAQVLGFSAIAQQHRAAAGRADDLKLDARTLAALAQFERARAVIRALGAIPGRAGEAAAELALLERMTRGEQAAIAALENLALDLSDPANEAALRSLATDLVSVGRADRAIADIERALRARPDSASLHALMGTTLARSLRPTEARSAFKRALAIDANHAEALGGIAAIAGAGGDREQAIRLFDRAAEIDPGNGSYAYAAAQLERAAGNRGAAEARLRAIVLRYAGHASARNDLAWMLASDNRELDLALSLAKEASRFSPEPATLDTLGFVYLAREEYPNAIDALEAATAMDGSPPSAHFHLALALSQTGETERAKDSLKRALAGTDFPETDAARQKLAELESR